MDHQVSCSAVCSMKSCGPFLKAATPPKSTKNHSKPFPHNGLKQRSVNYPWALIIGDQDQPHQQLLSIVSQMDCGFELKFQHHVSVDIRNPSATIIASMLKCHIRGYRVGRKCDQRLCCPKHHGFIST